jgi:hypothetical protein
MRFLIVFILIAISTATLARAQDFGQVKRMEAAHFKKLCRTVKFDSNYLTAFDFNNDKLIDAITSPGSVTCDGVKNPECSLLGCPHRFYAQLDDGSFTMIAEIQFYGLSTYMRYGNQVLVIDMQGGFCKRPIAEICRVTYRVRGTRFVELTRE